MQLEGVPPTGQIAPTESAEVWCLHHKPQQTREPSPRLGPGSCTPSPPVDRRLSAPCSIRAAVPDRPSRCAVGLWRGRFGGGGLAAAASVVPSPLRTLPPATTRPRSRHRRRHRHHHPDSSLPHPPPLSLSLVSPLLLSPPTDRSPQPPIPLLPPPHAPPPPTPHRRYGLPRLCGCRRCVVERVCGAPVGAVGTPVGRVCGACQPPLGAAHGRRGGGAFLFLGARGGWEVWLGVGGCGGCDICLWVV